MVRFTEGLCVERGGALQYREKLIRVFARSYDLRADRLWNCLRAKPRRMKFSCAAQMAFPGSVLLYLERSGETYRTTFEAVCRYVEQLEPWEFIDAYVFDPTYRWLLCLTHEDDQCLLVGDPAAARDEAAAR